MIYTSLREVKMQKFSYHTHTNSFGLFDGRNTVEEMIEGAYKAGYTELGISNHLIYHPNMHISSEAQKNDKMFHADKQKAKDIMTAVAQDIREKAKKAPIKVYVGFEVDFFPSASWCKSFEEIIKQLDVDYLIGSTHFIRSSDEKFLLDIYFIRHLKTPLPDNDLKLYLQNYWLNIVEAVKSGYFNFIAHLDYITICNLCTEAEWDEYKWKVIEALAEKKHPFELNTSGYDRIGKPHPDIWMLKELQKRNVPVVISDDAHCTEHLSRHFEKAETLLASLNYQNRWKIEK